MDKIEQKIIDIIDQNADKIIAFGDDIWHHAELGFQEFRTSDKFAKALTEMGLSCDRELAITGVRSYLKEKQDGEVRLALMGELDALPFPNHVDANPETGAAHCCGHNAQLTGVMGAALALTDPEIREALGGNIVFFGVPSEEGSTAPDVKAQLRAEGKIQSLGGKCEFIRHGVMDDIDMTVGHHVGNIDEYSIPNKASLGFVEKHAVYTGIRQHPAYSFRAVDALSAATLAMHAVDQQREAFNMFHKWNTHLVHGYIRSGGVASNIVSDHVELEYNIRAKTIEAIEDIAYRVDRCIKAGAIAGGAGLSLVTEPGYMPIVPLKDVSVIEEVFALVDPEHKHNVVYPEKLSGTTDYGDLSCIMPVMQFQTCGHGGNGHNENYHVADPYEYYVVPAKCFALLAYRLLKDDAALAKKMIADNPPAMTKEAYLELLSSLSKTETMELETPKTPM